jgi:hypothetical protein
MATYLDIYNLRRMSSNLRNRVTVAVVKAAQDVLNEDAGTPNHAGRLRWAQTALQDAEGMAERLLWGVVGNAAIQANGEASADGDLQFVVNGLIDTFAMGA